MAKGGKSKAKATKTFLKKGLLEGQIKSRHEARALKQKVVGRAVQRNKGGKPKEVEKESEDEADIKLDAESESEDEPGLDAILDGEGQEEEEDDDLEDDDLADLDGDDEDEPVSNEQHIADLKALAEKDPEFFKYLQENDAELLDFGGEGAEESSDEEMEDAQEEQDDEDDEDSEDEDSGKKSKKGKGKEKELAIRQTPVLTKEILKSWQTAIITVGSPPSLRIRAHLPTDSFHPSAAKAAVGIRLGGVRRRQGGGRAMGDPEPGRYVCVSEHGSTG